MRVTAARRAIVGLETYGSVRKGNAESKQRQQQHELCGGTTRVYRSYEVPYGSRNRRSREQKVALILALVVMAGATALEKPSPGGGGWQGGNGGGGVDLARSAGGYGGGSFRSGGGGGGWGGSGLGRSGSGSWGGSGSSFRSGGGWGGDSAFAARSNGGGGGGGGGGGWQSGSCNDNSTFHHTWYMRLKMSIKNGDSADAGKPVKLILSPDGLLVYRSKTGPIQL
ncbi:hypothetical protein EVAR_98430_1 [Eumeta japonica]|uniref:Uncharacterized protein n=1 Tax=Eumeta variegata TaxID=151549 RepID=A0A4C1ZYQ4_EUMVA|nr:hypothetical protein EVAR_98430_1 [Eumeta japonica]